jgi:hypothetical protein
LARSKRNDSYLTFLKTIKELEQQDSASQQQAQQPTATIERSRRMLTYLADHDGPQPVTDLLGISGLTLGDFYTAMTTLQDVGLITMNGEPGQEQAELTTAGRYVAQME